MLKLLWMTHVFPFRWRDGEAWHTEWLLGMWREEKNNNFQFILFFWFDFFPWMISSNFVLKKRKSNYCRCHRIGYISEWVSERNSIWIRLCEESYWSIKSVINRCECGKSCFQSVVVPGPSQAFKIITKRYILRIYHFEYCTHPLSLPTHTPSTWYMINEHDILYLIPELKRL